MGGQGLSAKVRPGAGRKGGSVMDVDIGIKIKELRLSLKLTQEELADRCELTKGYISQLENDLTSPSIETLKDILAALGTNLKQFFSEEAEDKLTFTEADYVVKDNGDSSITWLVPNSQKNEMEPILMKLRPGAMSAEDMPHEGEEFGYLLKGKLRLRYGKREQELSAGDTFYFSADKVHSLENIGSEEAEILWVSAPPNF